MDSKARGAEERGPAAPRKRRFVLQWSLQTLLLLTAVVAVWVGYLRYRLEIPRLEREIDAMKRMAAELIVEDPQRVAAVMLPAVWMDEPRWDIHLPDGVYVMRLATREIDKTGLAPTLGESPIDAGRHLIELQKSDDEDGWRFTVLVDDRSTLEAKEKPDWDPVRASEGGAEFAICTQLPPDEPVVLYRRRFQRTSKNGQSVIPEGPTEGVMLWIERVGE